VAANGLTNTKHITNNKGCSAADIFDTLATFLVSAFSTSPLQYLKEKAILMKLHGN
jgi:hypothetical protein